MGIRAPFFIMLGMSFGMPPALAPDRWRPTFTQNDDGREIAMVAPEIVDCIREDRAPTVLELGRVADIVAREALGHRSVFAWIRPSDPEKDKMIAFRFAHAALAGSNPLVFQSTDHLTYRENG